MSAELTHIATQHDQVIIDLVMDIVASNSLTAWFSGLSEDLARDVNIRFAE